jgi:hypothetical protein
LCILLPDTDIRQIGTQSGDSKEHLSIVHVVPRDGSSFGPLSIDITAFNLVPSELTVTIDASIRRENMRPSLGYTRHSRGSQLVGHWVSISLKFGKTQVGISDKANPRESKQNENTQYQSGY